MPRRTKDTVVNVTLAIVLAVRVGLRSVVVSAFVHNAFAAPAGIVMLFRHKGYAVQRRRQVDP